MKNACAWWFQQVLLNQTKNKSLNMDNIKLIRIRRFLSLENTKSTTLHFLPKI